MMRQHQRLRQSYGDSASALPAGNARARAVQRSLTLGPCGNLPRRRVTCRSKKSWDHLRTAAVAQTSESRATLDRLLPDTPAATTTAPLITPTSALPPPTTPPSPSPPVASQPALPPRAPLLEEYAGRSTAVFKDCQALDGLGLHVQLETPTIVVGGDRGSGKSLVVTRLCGVDVPLGRGDGQPGLRCPLMLHMIKAQPVAGGKDCPMWYQVKLRRTHDSVTGELLPHVLVTPFGGPIIESTDLMDAMLRAQATLLNPGRPASDFLDYLPLDPDANELLVSSNAVLVEVHGAPMNVLVVDLPGLMPYHEAYAPGLIDQQLMAARQLRNMTVEYMGLRNAALVAVVSCCTDVAHQEVLDLARRVDPAGRRTLGVLTHACSPGAPTHTLGARELLTGRVMPLRLGYVLLDSPASSGNCDITTSTTRTPVAVVAKSGSPAPSSPDAVSPLMLLTQDAQQANRLGEGVMGHLASGLLLEQLALQMPAIQAQVMGRLAELDAQLASLTPSARPEELAHHARAQLRALSRAFDASLRGQGAGPGAKQLVRDVMGAYREFGKRIVASRPRFMLLDPDTKQPKRAGSGSPSLGDHFASALGGSPKEQQEPVLARYGEEDEEGDPLYWPGVALSSVDDVKKLIAAQRGAELPTGDMPDSATTWSIRQFQAGWRRDAEMLLDGVAARLLDEMVGLVGAHFGAHPRLADLLKGHCVDLVSGAHQRARAQLTMLVDMELAQDNPPLTTLDRHFKTLQEVLASSMQDVRARALTHHQPQLPMEDRATKVEAVRQLLHQLGTDTSGWTDQQLLERLGVATAQEQDGSAIRVMAACMAFFKVSSRRFRDTVPLFVRHNMLNAVASSFDDHMERCLLELAATDACRTLDCSLLTANTKPTTSTTSSSTTPSSSSASSSSRAGSPLLSDECQTTMPLGWASSPAVLCLMSGGPLDAVKEVEQQELLRARDVLAGLLKRVAAHMHPHGAA